MKMRVFPILFVSILSLSLISCDGKDDKNKIEKTAFSYKYSDIIDNYYLNKSCTPSIGSPNLLVLPIWFSDSSEFVPQDKLNLVCNDLNKVFFGTTSDTGWHSVKSFYETESRGKCSLKGVVADPFVTSDSYALYAQESVNTSLKTQQLVTEAVNAYFANSNKSRSEFDLDNDGYLDGVIAIYIAPDSSNFDDPLNKGNLWAYTNWMNNEADSTTPITCAYMWASYDFMYSKSDSITKFGAAYSFGSGDTRFSSYDAHRYIHEMGHMFGLPDYYDYSSYRYKPAGGFSMQDYNVGGHDPYSTIALGWTNPYIPTKSCTIEINKFQSSNEVILLTNKINDDNSPFDEYFLLEFYSPTGLNEFDINNAYCEDYPVAPNESGIRLWHVDARLIYTSDTSFSNTNTTCNPKISGFKVSEMMSNSYYSAQSKSNISRLGSIYADYNILQLIRNDELETFKPSSTIDEYSLFKDGDSFTINRLKKQFKNTGKLNSGEDFKWTFSVVISGEKATINLKRTSE